MTGTPELGVGINRMAVLSGHGHGAGGRRGRAATPGTPDGSTIDIDVAALGGIRNIEWLAGSGLAAGRWGVACDAGCRAFDVNRLVTDNVFVAGDVARAPQPMFGYQLVSLEHWGNAVAQAEIAAHDMISAQADRWPHLWSRRLLGHASTIAIATVIAITVVSKRSNQ
jgi:NADPH-dependent 2,4-dienoyl-CoA reductase/sulfur reductase-like enzyme